MKNSIFLCLQLIFICLLSTNCSTTESDNINSEGFYVTYVMSEDGANARADATFYVGGITGTVIQLSAGDSVTCNGNVLSENQDFIGKYYYFGGCGALATDNTYTFVFTRAVTGGDDEVYTSTVTMPAAVNITSPADSATFTRGQTIPVTWTAGGAGDSISVSLSGSGQSADSAGTTSFSAGSSSLTDNGTHTLSATNTNPASITGAITNGQINVTRTRSGTMDASLSGVISARRQDSVTSLTLNP